MNLAYLTDIIILLAAAVIVVPLSRFAGFGIVPVFLIAGVAVGPSALSLIDNAAEIAHLAELGVVLLLGLFFMSMGMSIELALLFKDPLVSIGLVLLLMSTKAVLLWPLARLFGHKGGIALAIALLLAQSGEFALVIFAVAFKGDLLDEGLFQQLLLVVVLSMLATPPPWPDWRIGWPLRAGVLPGQRHLQKRMWCPRR